MSHNCKFACGVERNIFRLSWRGFGLIEAIVVLTVSMSLIGIASKYIKQQADNALNHTTAQQLQQLTLATNHYAHDHFDQLQHDTNGNQSIEWKWSDIRNYLQKSGYLPVTFREMNPYQQNYRIVVQQPEPQLLQILILTEAGQALKESNLRQIVQFAGPQSGFISHLQPRQLTGSQGGWELPLTSSLKVSPGHIAALNYLKANEVLSASSLLFRKKIDGHDEYNKMETDLKMAANIELEDGTKIWFNHGSARSTLIENSRITLQGAGSVTLKPGKIKVNTTAGVNGYPAIITNSHMEAAGDVRAGRNMSAAGDMNISGNVKVLQNLSANIVNAAIFKESSYNIADIPLYKIDNMYEHNSIWNATMNHCKNYPQRLFMLRDHGNARHLMMCLPSPRTEYTYWMLATGYYNWDQGELNRPRPFKWDNTVVPHD